MYISEYMTADPITITAEMSIPEARQMMNENLVRHLPVVDRQEKLIGIVTDRDLRSAYPSSVTSHEDSRLAFEQVEKTQVVEIMTVGCSTLNADASLDDALLIFDRDKVGGIPIVNEAEKVIGMFSLLDLVSAYRQLFGVAESGSILLGVKDDGRSHILCELVNTLEELGVTLTRLMRLDDDNNGTAIYMRITCTSPEEVITTFSKKGFSFVHL